MPPLGPEGYSAKVVNGRLVVLTDRPLDFDAACALHSQIVTALFEMAPPDDPNWRRNPARARTSGVGPKL